MALSVAQFAAVSNWFTTTTPQTITGLAWSSGDIIVVVGLDENANAAISTPTNANLTFTLQASVTTGGGSEAEAYVWTATAGSAQTSQTISVAATGGLQFGAAAWVITGSPSGVANATANQTETAPSLTVGAGSVVIFALADFNATTPTKTPLTGSGTATERFDTGNGTNYGVYGAEWVGTSAGTFSFGPNNYTGLQIAQVAIEITAPAGPPAAVSGLFNSGRRRI